MLEQADVVHESDLGMAWKILRALHGDDDKLAGRHAAYLEAECEAMLGCGRATAMVLALASELMVRRTMAAREWLAILRRAAA